MNNSSAKLEHFKLIVDKVLAYEPVGGDTKKDLDRALRLFVFLVGSELLSRGDHTKLYDYYQAKSKEMFND